MQKAKRRVSEALIAGLAQTAIDLLPPIAVRTVGEGLIHAGIALQRAGDVLEEAGHRTVAYADQMSDNNRRYIRKDAPTDTAPQGPIRGLRRFQMALRG